MAGGLTAVENAARQIDARSWDEFAQNAGAGYRGSQRHIRGWALKHKGRARVAYFSLHHDADGSKVGQCAVGRRRGGGVFLDRLMLDPAAEVHWPTAMHAVLRELDEGTYTYGWELSTERTRADDLRSCPGVTVTHNRRIVVEAVEYSNWDSWEAYYKSISNNVRRNVKKAATEIPSLRIARYAGWRAVRHVPTVVRLRSEMYRRKGLGFRSLLAGVNGAANLLVGRDHYFTALALDGNRPLAAFTGTAFGSVTYYMDGASQVGNHGASWYLIIEMLRSAFMANPRGLFVFGYVDHALHNEDRSGGLLRSRRSCRVSDLETSVVTFRWSGRSTDME